MSTLRIPCPSCKRQLELPTSALGRLGKCPACEAVFTVTTTMERGDQEQPAQPPAPTKSGPLAPPRQDSPPNSTSEQISSSNQISSSKQHETRQQRHEAGPEVPQPRTPLPEQIESPVPEQIESPVYQDANPFSSPLEDGTAAHLSKNPYGYGPVYNADDPVAEVGTLKITSRPIDEVFATAFSIFGDRCGLLILAFLLSVVSAVVLFVAPILLLRIIAGAGGGAFAGIAFLLILPMLILASGYISVGLARNALAVARDSPAPMSELIPPIGIVVRFLVGAGLMTVCVAVIGIIFGGLMSLVSAGGNNGLVTLATVLVFFASAVLSMAVYWLLWSWPFIVSDGRGTAIGSMQASVALTMHNKTTSILLVVVSFVLSVVGTTMCYVGHLITAPLTMLLLAVAYLLITNQRVSDPRISRQRHQYPPPEQSPY